MINRLKEIYFHPLINTIILLLIIAFIYFYFLFFYNNKFTISLSYNRIENKINEIVNYCKNDNFIDWIVVDKKRYYFQDVVGCNYSSDKNCSFSVKRNNLNQFYNRKDLILDEKTYSLLNSLDTGQVAYYNDLEFLSKFKTFDEAFSNSNKKITKIAFSITRNYISGLVYVFMWTNTGNNICDKNYIVNNLQELSLIAKEGLL